MDTLCIPVGLGKVLRRKAITQMNFIFAGADNVLVIDPILQGIHAKSVSKLQLRLQIACSPWMSRCWTFQEACLARAWHVYLSSTLYDPAMDHGRETDPLYRIMTAKSIWTDENELEHEAISFYDKLWPLVDQRPGYRPSFRGPEKTNVEELARIWGQLNERSTTRREDRLIILAILLDLNPGEILSLDLVEQTRAILRTQDTLPLSLMFEPQAGPIVEKIKCRWIPLYPEGEMTTAYGCMSKDQVGRYYHFKLADIKAYGFLIGANDVKYRQFHIELYLPFRLSAWIRTLPRDGFTACSRPGNYCVILSRMKRQSRDLGSFLVGARFAIEDMNSDMRSCRLIYDCPLEYTLDKSVGVMSLPPIPGDLPNVRNFTRSSMSPTHTASAEWHQVEATLLPEVADISVDCGESARFQCDRR